MDTEVKNKDMEICVETVSHEAVTTIRCLSAIPQDLEKLLAEISRQDEAVE